jgi:hypothetical protein
MQHRVISCRDWVDNLQSIHSRNSLHKFLFGAKRVLSSSSRIFRRLEVWLHPWGPWRTWPEVQLRMDLSSELVAWRYVTRLWFCWMWDSPNKRLPCGHVYTIRWNCEFGDGLPHGDFVGCVI